jgi:hypothetical protein
MYVTLYNSTPYTVYGHTYNNTENSEFFFSHPLENNVVLVFQTVNASFAILSSTSVYMMLLFSHSRIE